MSVLVVGTVAFDSIETPSGSAERILGGSASYFALAASFFTSVRIVGVIGQDFPQEYLDLFSQRKIDLEGLRRENGDTFHWRGRYHEDINVRDTLELHLNVLAGFVPDLPAGADSRIKSMAHWVKRSVAWPGGSIVSWFNRM